MSAVIQADSTATRKTKVFRCMNSYKQLFLWTQSGTGSKAPQCRGRRVCGCVHSLFLAQCPTSNDGTTIIFYLLRKNVSPHKLNQFLTKWKYVYSINEGLNRKETANTIRILEETGQFWGCNSRKKYLRYNLGGRNEGEGGGMKVK